MKGYTVFLFVILTTAISAEGGETPRRESRKQWMVECSAETRTDVKAVKAYLEARSKDQDVDFPKNFGCFLKCMFLRDEVMSSKGEINLPDKMPFKDLVMPCVKAIPNDITDLCAKALEAHKCYLAVTPDGVRKRH